MNFYIVVKHNLTKNTDMLGEQIKILRDATEGSQVELANKLCVTKRSVSNLENENIMPSNDMLIKIAEYVGVTPDYLLGLSENRTLNTDNLSENQIAHIQILIDDILGK